MSDAISGDRPPTPSVPLTAADQLFLLFLLGLVLLVGFLGSITYQEGVKTRSTKTEAEALLNWMKEASSRRAEAGFEPAACAYRAAGSTTENTWANCEHALLNAGGPLYGLRNAFTGEPVALIDRCKTTDLGTAGQIMIERISATPPGAAIAFVVGSMAATDGIGQKMTFRITVCDKGGYTIRVGETEF